MEVFWFISAIHLLIFLPSSYSIFASIYCWLYEIKLDQDMRRATRWIGEHGLSLASEKFMNGFWTYSGYRREADCYRPASPRREKGQTRKRNRKKNGQTYLQRPGMDGSAPLWGKLLPRPVLHRAEVFQCIIDQDAEAGMPWSRTPRRTMRPTSFSIMGGGTKIEGS